MTELSSRYNPKEVEDKWLAYWKTNHTFHATPSNKTPFTIVIPPPNVTGILHMGHALNNTLQDILIRYKRMNGFEALWMPGTDHAGIATQNVVEKELAKEGKKRQDLGREEFIKRLWAWKENYGDTIIRQLEKLGSSCDWERTRFTMDDEYSQAVQEVFIRLYEKDLIYRGNRIINWCPRCQTALSDEEAEHKEKQGKLYYIKYPLKSAVIARSPQATKQSQTSADAIASAQKTGLSGLPPGAAGAGAMTGEYVTVATTRPETMLGDTAVAVNPKDERYTKLVGQTLVLPLIGREIKIIADDFVSAEFGTGAVKVTPAHDPNDFAMGQRHNLEFINIMQPDAVLNENAGKFKGMDRFAGRKAVIAELEAQGLLVKVEDHMHAIGHCYRCDTVVEPRLSKQWFVKMKPLAEPALKAVKSGRTRIHPERWEKVYLNWMEEIRDWCISRQIWWGHRIPVWYCVGDDKCLLDCKKPIVSRAHPKNCPYCGSQNLKQDEDVLDTWFSSWLWPFATLGWPEQQVRSQPVLADRPGKSEVRSEDLNDLEFFYPTNALFTASEIIFFWVARMIMAGYEFMGDAPFADVYIHGTVRDAKGRKMSKSLGNALDPLEIINEFGADALRFSLIINSGQDIFISKEKFEIGRNFANKIWNASRLIFMNVKPEAFKDFDTLDLKGLDLPSRWIVSQLYSTIEKVGDAIEKYRYSEAETLVQDFFWGNFCDWYLEIIKSQWANLDIQKVALHVLERSLRMMHPFIPFITEEIYSKLSDGKECLSRASWPVVKKEYLDAQSQDNMQTLIALVSGIRNVRVQLNIKPQEEIECVLVCRTDTALWQNNIEILRRLAKIKNLTVTNKEQSMKETASGVVDQFTKFFIPLGQLIDVAKEKSRIKTKIGQQSSVFQSIKTRLANEGFVAKAPVEVIEKEQARLIALKAEIDELNKVLESLS